MIRLFGLTGGVASGKSTVARRFAERGVPVIDADQVARDVVVPGSEGLSRVVEAFGEGVLAADGALDRAALGKIVFADATLRRRLESILHPLIGAETRRRAAALEAAGVRLGCYEAALLVENGLADAFRPLVVVAVAADVQLRRLRDRDGLAEEDAKRRIAAQKPLHDKIAVADYVIHNDGTLAELVARADEVLDAIVAEHG